MIRLLILLLLAPMATLANPDSLIRDSLVYLTAEGQNPSNGVMIQSQATGFFVTKDGFLLTADHFFDDFRKNKVRHVTIKAKRRDPDSPLQFNVRYVREVGDVDLMLLKMRIPDGSEPAVPAILGRTTALDPMGDAVFRTSGFTGLDYSRDDGRIITASDRDLPYAWRFGFSVKSGQSGSPVYDEDGKIVGIVKGNRSENDPESLVIPIEFATPLIAHIRFERQEQMIAALSERLDVMEAEMARQKMLDEVGNKVSALTGRERKLTDRVNLLTRFVGEPLEDIPPLTERVGGVEGSMDEIGEHMTWTADTTPDGDIKIDYSKLVSTGTHAEKLLIFVEPKFWQVGVDGIPFLREGFLIDFNNQTFDIKKNGRFGNAVVSQLQSELSKQIAFMTTPPDRPHPLDSIEVHVIPMITNAEGKLEKLEKEVFIFSHNDIKFPLAQNNL